MLDAAANAPEIDLTGAVFVKDEDIIRLPDGTWLPAMSGIFYSLHNAWFGEGVTVRQLPHHDVMVIVASPCSKCGQQRDPRDFGLPTPHGFKPGDGWSLPGAVCIFCASTVHA